MPPKKAAGGPSAAGKKQSGGARPAKKAADPVPEAPAPISSARPTVEQLLAAGRVEALTAHRVVLAHAIVVANPAELPRLVHEHISVIAQLDALTPKGISTVESIRQRSGARRAARRAEALQPTRRSQPRRSNGSHRNGAT